MNFILFFTLSMILTIIQSLVTRLQLLFGLILISFLAGSFCSQKNSSFLGVSKKPGTFASILKFFFQVIFIT